MKSVISSNIRGPVQIHSTSYCIVPSYHKAINTLWIKRYWASQVVLVVKCQCRQLIDAGSTPIPVFLPGESHGQENLLGYGP